MQICQMMSQIKEKKRRPEGGWANEIVIYMSEFCCLYYDLDDSKLKIEGGQFDEAAKDLVDKIEWRFDNKIKQLLRDPQRIDSLLNSTINPDDLTNLLLRYKLLIEKKLFRRT